VFLVCSYALPDGAVSRARRRAAKWHYARALYENDGATLDDLREAVTTLEETSRIARRVLGARHPEVADYEASLRESQAALRARETQPSGDS
jgi:hypothetical protein